MQRPPVCNAENMKTCALNPSKNRRELRVYRQISKRLKTTSDRGRNNVRNFNSFVVHSPHGEHAILVLEAAQVSLWDMRMLLSEYGFDEYFVKAAMIELLRALDFLHSHAQIVHTGMAKILAQFYWLTNYCQVYILGTCSLVLMMPIMITFSNDLKTCKWNPLWLANQSVTPNRTIYRTRMLLPKEGPMLLSVILAESERYTL